LKAAEKVARMAGGKVEPLAVLKVANWGVLKVGAKALYKVALLAAMLDESKVGKTGD